MGVSRNKPIRIAAAVMAFAPATLLYLVTSPARGLPFVLVFDQDDLFFKKLSPFTRILSFRQHVVRSHRSGRPVLIILGESCAGPSAWNHGWPRFLPPLELLALILPHEAMNVYFLRQADFLFLPLILFLTALRPRLGRSPEQLEGRCPRSTTGLRSSVLTLGLAGHWSRLRRRP